MISPPVPIGTVEGIQWESRLTSGLCDVECARGMSPGLSCSRKTPRTPGEHSKTQAQPTARALALADVRGAPCHVRALDADHVLNTGHIATTFSFAACAVSQHGFRKRLVSTLLYKRANAPAAKDCLPPPVPAQTTTDAGRR